MYFSKTASLGRDRFIIRRPSAFNAIFITSLKEKEKEEIQNCYVWKQYSRNLLFKPPNFNLTFRKQNQKDLHIQLFENFQEIIRTNQQFIFKTPKISLMEDLINEFGMVKNCTFNYLQIYENLHEIIKKIDFSSV